MLHNRKVRSEAVEKAQAKMDGEAPESAMDSPALHKDDLLDDEENEMSENESVGTQPEEEEDAKLSGEELGKKLEKVLKHSETQLQALNTSAHQLRATCFGQDRYWRRYWSLPKAGGVFVEAMESAQPDVLDTQAEADKASDLGIKSVDDIKRIIHEDENIYDPIVDSEVNDIVGSQEEAEEDVKLEEDKNEHRKTPNRFEILENGETMDKSERNLDELRKSVDRIVQNLERSIEFDREPIQKNTQESQDNKLFNHEDDLDTTVKTEPESEHKKFNLFEKLGQCMERENKNDDDIKSEVKQEVKDELKNEILNELKSEIKTEVKHESEEERSDSEHKWFSILPKDGATCEGVVLAAGNKWDNGVGLCIRENLTELKIPVFPPPNSSASYVPSSCDSPAPLQMTAEESTQLEYIKKHGLPKPCERKTIPVDKRYGWWRITDTDQLKTVLDNLHVRGARERELKRTFISTMQSMYERQGRLHIEEGQNDATELSVGGAEEIRMLEGGAPAPDLPGSWNPSVGQRVDLFLLEQVSLLRILKNLCLCMTTN